MGGSSRQPNAGDRAIHLDRDRRVDGLLASVASPGRLLDLGCGHGRAVAQLDLSRWSTAVGVDRDGATLQASPGLVPSVSFVLADGAALPFPRSAFRVVVASTLFSSLLAWDVARAVAREMARVLVPDGVVLWYDLRRPSPTNADVRPLGRRDIAALFPGWELDLRPATLLPPLARRLGPLVGLYPALAWVPALDSHWLGLVRAPAGG